MPHFGYLMKYLNLYKNTHEAGIFLLVGTTYILYVHINTLENIKTVLSCYLFTLYEFGHHRTYLG